MTGSVLIPAHDEERVLGGTLAGDLRRPVPAAVAGDGAFRLSQFAFFEVLAGHPEVMAHRLQRKQVAWTDFNAITASGAQVVDNLGQVVPVHDDCVEITDAFTVGKTEAAPGAALSPARDKRGGETTVDTLVVTVPASDIAATGTGQPRHLFFLGSEFDTEIIGDNLVHFSTVYRTGTGLQFTGDQLFRKYPAARSAAGPAVGMRQQILHLVDFRILVNEQTPVGDHQHRCQNQPKAGHKTDRYKDIHQGRHGSSESMLHGKFRSNDAIHSC